MALTDLRLTRAFKLGLLAAGALALSACASTQTGDTSTGAGTGTSTAGAPAQGSVEEFTASVGDRVFFGFDRYDLDSQATETLSRQAAWMKLYPSYTVTIEGHADERGTREYNFALAARRANAVRDYLVGLGVDSARLKTISYGKERPTCSASTESCWAQNRRGVSVLAGGAPGV
ncbi:MAG: peptidoglycan-associated lipoprotein Pal [Alphaproteobacteria bacterium]|nr:peptidoglycan-associated lipoprotein Pal [Alphaproteobacteria bacterium]